MLAHDHKGGFAGVEFEFGVDDRIVEELCVVELRLLRVGGRRSIDGVWIMKV